MFAGVFFFLVLVFFCCFLTIGWVSKYVGGRKIDFDTRVRKGRGWGVKQGIAGASKFNWKLI